MHANEAVIFHGAAVDHCVVANGDVLAEGEWVAGVDVAADVVLDVGALTDHDRFVVSTQYCVEPDAHVGVQGDIAGQASAWCDVARVINAGGAVAGNRNDLVWVRHAFSLEP